VTVIDATETLELLSLDPAVRGRATHRADLPGCDATFGQLSTPLHDETAARLAARGIAELYAHQAAAINRIRNGEHTVVAAGTASGKSLCYQLPIIDAAVAKERATALCIFPTKALAQDQLQSLRGWLVPGLKAVTYDGDTATNDRVWARGNANVVLTNPEMLHVGMLPSHSRWATFFMRLRYVVIDELHTLRGVFGSHVALVLRRLRRLCERYGSTPTFCLTSATIGNPAELAAQLVGAPVALVDEDGAPRGPRRLVVWERPLLDAVTGARPSAIGETAALLAALVRDDHQTLAFCRGRRTAEVVALEARRALAGLPAPIEDNDFAGVDTTTVDVDNVLAGGELDGTAAPESRIAAYRAGLLGDERRAVEKALRERAVLGVAATNALELGIDLPGLDAVVLNGFPGTLASFRQQVGRAGRAGQHAVAALVVGDDQLDQWYAQHPDELVSRPSEPAVVNVGNEFVLEAHVRCAAHEQPLTPDDAQWFGPDLDERVVELVRAGRLVARGSKLYSAETTPPARSIGLRTGTTAEIMLVDRTTDRVIGTVDESRAGAVVHPGAVYVHQGQHYRVALLDLHDHAAYLDECGDEEYTQARTDTDIVIRATDDRAPIDAALGSSELGAIAHLGSVEVTNTVVGYQRKRAATREVIETVPLELPPRVLLTRACWYTIPHELIDEARITASELLGAVHAAEHGLIGLLPLFAICDRWDVGGLSMAIHPETEQPTIFIYDAYPGGAGVAEMAFAARAEHVAASLDLVSRCRCEWGCPSCVQSPKCGNWNEYLDKQAAVRLLTVMRGSPARATHSRH
jgi:DEAD/DEAH box helicase domain-containing protein